ncbi:DUF2171 domain-containing protein [Frigoriglobus tundricola]|uniref:DUF2171 domain-containing protein n=1 Tax=Frigoriglobus tundricola TaxID=2774151 RepID=A0A6M5YF45_9BACT|nr:DUF2171 domain-containing protein [Frigoriglobus tundricola]QJW92627.1 hypothetical protein FTUN_0124 [Frigoriglobus tundricola]
MANNTSDKINEAGKRVADNVAHAADWVKDKTGVGPGRTEGSDAGVAGIRQHMDVIASCGKTIGVVDRVEGSAIKLTKDSTGDGMHHFLPTSMVDHVDRHVHLNKNSEEAMKEWKPSAASCGSCG